MSNNLSDTSCGASRPNRLTVGILATLVWIMLAGTYVQQRLDVPSLVDYKASAANVLSCPTGDVASVNRCLDARYDAVIETWRNETGAMVVLPPMLAWIATLLGSLGREFGLFRRRPASLVTRP